MAVRISSEMGNPRIDDTRINIYDVFSALKFNAPPERIGEQLMLIDDQVEAALQFIASHREEVEAGYRRVMDPEKRRNPPELQAKLDAISAKYAPAACGCLDLRL